VTERSAQVFEDAGWSCVVTTPLAGGMVAAGSADPDEAPVGVLVVLEKNGFELRAIAETIGQALDELAPQAARFDGRRLAA
jgi:hypothetical protein